MNSERATVYRAVCCSGASNAGEIADKVVRLLDSHGEINMNCLTKIAINDMAIIEKYRTCGGRALVVDGCAVDCAKKILEKAGVTEFVHVRMTDEGVKKGSTPVNDDVIGRVTAAVRTRLQ